MNLKTTEFRLVSGLFAVAYLLALLPLHTYSASINSNGKSEPTRNTRRHSKGSRKETVYESLPLQPSMVMVPLDLQESVNPDLDPDVENLDNFHLLDIMGEDYDSKYMSLRKPSEMDSNPDGKLLYQFTKDQLPRGDMPAEIEALSGKTIELSEGGPELKIKFSRKARRKIQKFFWSYSYCPVRYRWKELSIRFWPRWIKEGECENKRSCSIPAGMKCQPSKIQNISILRYYCPFSGTCEWIKIQYPILAQCSCGCQQYSDSDYYT
ncbi:noggin-2-like [Watersipora subatra]|uniref:noggin-2-like n=1 Tax=Watersipora subatra TaxID=2589382 RepID=UPI00355ACDC1